MRSAARTPPCLARLAALCALVVIAPSATAAPAPVYVSPSGDNGNSGTSPAEAWRTIGHAVSHAAGGQTIYVLDDGVEDLDDYVENVVVDQSVLIRSHPSNIHRPGVQAAVASSPVLKLTARGAVIEGLWFNGAATSVGLELSGAVECQVRDNFAGVAASPNRTGISLSGGCRNVIDSNFCYDNTETGIELHLTSGNVLWANQSQGSPRNLHLAEGSGNVLVFNILQDSDGPAQHGLTVDEGAGDNVICQNVIRSNYYGIYLESLGGNLLFENFVTQNTVGMFVGSKSGQDTFIENDFYDNAPATVGCATPGAYDLGNGRSLLYRYDATYHRAPLGNYYSDYAGTDGNGDGIGDTPYGVALAEDTHPRVEKEGTYDLKIWMLTGGGGIAGLVEDSASSGSAPLAVDGHTSRTFSTTVGAPSTWSYCGGDPARASSWSGWLTFASPPAAGHPLRVTVGTSDAGGAGFQPRIPPATVTGDGSRSLLSFAAPGGCLVLPRGGHLAVRVENLGDDPFHLMASGAACVVAAPLSSFPGRIQPWVNLLLLP